MFGHIDAGCLHVRPAFDLSDPKDEILFLELSDKVAQLTQEFGGLMWGEHGKGYRSRYVPMFFGEELYPELQKIKAAFDPFNQLNPGKIATTPDASTHLLEVKGPLRGHFDRQIESSLREKNTIVLSCDGNGACFNYEVNDFMCPSYKVTKDRLHSPKGRAALVREWLRQLSASKKKVRFPLHRLFNGFGKRLGAYDYSHEVYRSMQGCLACKACTTQCPVHIDVPSFRSRFLEQYHGRYMRSLSDYLIAHSEKITYYQQHFPSFSNWLFQRSLTRFFLKKFAGLVDTPLLATPNIKRCFSKNKIPYVDISVLSQLDKPQKEKTLVIIQDWVTSFYEPPLVVAFYEFLTKLGYDVYMIPWFPNGKPLHLKGYLKRFKRVAEENCKQLQAIDRLGITLLGVDPSMLLTFRHEYPELLGKASVQFKTHLIQEWFADQLANSAFNRPHLSRNGKEYLLLSHCTEKTAQVQTDHLWRRIFEAFGLKLKLVNTGCCGMAGSYGHERLHQKESKQLFAMSWQTHMPTASEEKAEILVTGYSCRSQVRRLTSLKPKHPIEVLNSLLE